MMLPPVGFAAITVPTHPCFVVKDFDIPDSAIGTVAELVAASRSRVKPEIEPSKQSNKSQRVNKIGGITILLTD